MAIVENRSKRQWDVTGLPTRDKEGKVIKNGETYMVPRAKANRDGAMVPGSCEIPDAVLKTLLAEDQWTKGVFATGRDLVVVETRTVVPPSTSRAIPNLV